ncbi:hypothetical protein [Cellulomonas sp.]|uniref:hypothetical protein n=1 Tax=Cellulomonas sp. TaxID=40001 RepID=UPI00258978DA|nr:hypothetical protein [Cellulomonas sp.]MCR6689358.1 hypothetical protein [Cellulomonas sp.]
MVTREAAIAELLDCGAVDWVSLQEVVWYGTLGETSPHSKALVADVLRQLFELGLMIPGDLGHCGFEDWEPPKSDWLDRALAELERLNWAPMGDGFWFRLAH